MTTVSSTSSYTTTYSSESEADNDALISDYETFLTLLTTQLQYQDPLDPMDTSEYTSQLVEYSSVEQAIKTNDNLEQLIGLYSNNELSSASSYIGKTALFDSAFAGLENGEASWIYSLDASAEELTIEVYDIDDNKVATLEGTKDAGTHKVTWDGKDEDGNVMEDGAYYIKVSGTTVNGADVGVGVATEGVVSAIESYNGETSAIVNGLGLPVSSILRVGNESTIKTSTSQQ